MGNRSFRQKNNRSAVQDSRFTHLTALPAGFESLYPTRIGQFLPEVPLAVLLAIVVPFRMAPQDNRTEGTLCFRIGANAAGRRGRKGASPLDIPAWSIGGTNRRQGVTVIRNCLLERLDLAESKLFCLARRFVRKLASSISNQVRESRLREGACFSQKTQLRVAAMPRRRVEALHSEVQHRCRQSGIDADPEYISGDEIRVGQVANDALDDIAVGRLA